MSTFEIVISIINIIAIVFIPIVAVLIGQYLQNRESKRKDKLNVFMTLMVNRVGWSPESVRALNIIDIVFADDENVRKKWKEYYNLLCIQSPDEMQARQTQTAQDKLLEAMAQSLGYKDKVTWETIQNPYIPKGMWNAMQQQQTIQAGQEKWANAVDIITKAFGSTQTPSQETDHQSPSA